MKKIKLTLKKIGRKIFYGLYVDGEMQAVGAYHIHEIKEPKEIEIEVFDRKERDG